MNGKSGLSNQYPQGIHIVAIAAQIHLAMFFTNLTSYRGFLIAHTKRAKTGVSFVFCTSVVHRLPLVVSRGITEFVSKCNTIKHIRMNKHV